MQPELPAPVALLGDADGGALLIEVEVRDLEPATRREPRPGVEIELQDRPVPVVDERLADRKGEELPGPGRRQREGLVNRVAPGAGDELTVGGVRDDDWQPEFRRGG